MVARCSHSNDNESVYKSKIGSQIEFLVWKLGITMQVLNLWDKFGPMLCEYIRYPNMPIGYMCLLI
jgi:hypothetical protein